ncbi:MAG: UvrD-helicase domain-containing protein, partial [Bacteroidota bacterium]
MRQFTLHPDPAPQPGNPESILDGLNPSQQEAARTTEGPVMIVAGAGSGKTRTVTYRIAYILASKKAWPSQILALTFTNKAAREMRERITKLVGPEGAKGLWMGTFHSTFARILRREAEAIGYTSDFSIYDSEDSRRVIRNLMNQRNIDTKQFSPRSIQGRISGAKNSLVTPEEYGRLAASAADEKA